MLIVAGTFTILYQQDTKWNDFKTFSTSIWKFSGNIWCLMSKWYIPFSRRYSLQRTWDTHRLIQGPSHSWSRQVLHSGQGYRECLEKRESRRIRGSAFNSAVNVPWNLGSTQFLPSTTILLSSPSTTIHTWLPSRLFGATPTISTNHSNTILDAPTILFASDIKHIGHLSCDTLKRDVSVPRWSLNDHGRALVTHGRQERFPIANIAAGHTETLTISAEMVRWCDKYGDPLRDHSEVTF